MNALSPSSIGSPAPDIVLFNKGGRDQRLKFLEEGTPAPREFFYGYFELAREFKVAMLSCADNYEGPLAPLMTLLEQIWSRLSHLGLRLWHVGRLQPLLSRSRVLMSFTDGYSITLGLYYRRKRGRSPFVIGGFHGLSDLEHRAPRVLRVVVKRLIAVGLRGLDHVFFFGSSDRDFAVRRYGLDLQKTSICRFGVDTDFWFPDPAAQIDETFIAVGQDPNRDFDLLASAPTNCRITIVTKNHVHVPANRTNVFLSQGSYFHPGALTDDRLRELYRRSLAIVVPLKDVYQPTGYSVTLQSMACGKPVVLSNIRGLWAPDLLRHEENCLLVPPGDASALAAALDRLAGDPSLRARLGNAARETALKHFSLDRLAVDVRRLAVLGMTQTAS